MANEGLVRDPRFPDPKIFHIPGGDDCILGRGTTQPIIRISAPFMLLCRCLVVFALSTSPSGVNVARLNDNKKFLPQKKWRENGWIITVFFSLRRIFAHLLNG